MRCHIIIFLTKVNFQSNGRMSVLVLLILVSNLNLARTSKSSTLSKSNVENLPIYPCHNAEITGGDGVENIQPTWIQSSQNAHDNIGIIETPKFPNHFPMPLRCVWIFNNTQKLAENHPTSLFIYFTRVNYMF